MAVLKCLKCGAFFPPTPAMQHQQCQPGGEPYIAGGLATMGRNSWKLQHSFFEVLFSNPLLNWSTCPWQAPRIIFSGIAISYGQKVADFNQSSKHHFVMREDNSYFRIWFFALWWNKIRRKNYYQVFDTLPVFAIFTYMCWKPDRVLVWNRTLWMIHIGGTIPYTRNVGNSWNTENRCCKKEKDVIRQCDEMDKSTRPALELG